MTNEQQEFDISDFSSAYPSILKDNMSFQSNCNEVSALTLLAEDRVIALHYGNQVRRSGLGNGGGGRGFGAVIIFIFIKFYLKVVTEPLTSAVSIRSLSPCSTAFAAIFLLPAKCRLSQEVTQRQERVWRDMERYDYQGHTVKHTCNISDMPLELHGRRTCVHALH